MEVRKYFECDAVYKELNENERSITHFITTPHRDREGECIDPYGMIDTDYKKAPSVFYNHNYNLPIAKSLWRVASEKGVLAKTKFGSTELAKDIYTLHKEDIIRTWSIGFRVPGIPGAVNTDEKTGTVFINKWELLEYSSAPVAMNPNCLDQVKTIVKSYEMIGEIQKIEAYDNIRKMLDENRIYTDELRTLYERMDGELSDAQKRISELTEKLQKETAEIAGKTLQGDEVRQMFAGAISSITGRKTKM